MITSANLTLAQLKSIFIEILINKTDKVSVVDDTSILNGVAFGVAKVGQKCIKDIAIVEAQIFPDYAVDTLLDRSAELFGASARRGAIGSSTYVKIVASEGTTYLSGVNNFVNQNGVIFELEENVTVGALGYAYAKVRSIDVGAKTNVGSNTIATVTPQPIGHVKVTNEYIATGGLDAEPDDVFRLRIKETSNRLAKTTLAYLTQVFQSLDDRILKVYSLGVNNNGNRVLSIVTQNGVDLTQNELDTLLIDVLPYLSISDTDKFGNSVGIELQNIEWHFVGGTAGIDFRAEIDASKDVDDVRINVQTAISKYLDFRFWNNTKRIEWDDLLGIVKTISGMRNVPDAFFNPRFDEIVPVGKLPRVKNFIMRDLQGNIIFDSGGVLSPIFYPSE